MIYWLAIIYFIVVMYLLGFSVSYLTRYKGKDWFESLIMKLAIGLGVFPLLTIILNWFSLIDWRVVFVISVIVPLISLFRKSEKSEERFKFVFKKSYIYYVIVLILFAATLFVYAKGAFIYPYLEDGDPLSQALATNYIYDTGTYSTPADQRVTHYLEPYPPFFPALNSIFLGLAKLDTIWTLKFFNALVISLGTLFMFFLVKKLTGSNAKGAVAAFFLMAINSYVSHFIFSTGYAITMMIPAMYFLLSAEKQDNNKKFKLFTFKKLEWRSIMLAAIMVSSVFLIQPTTSGLFALFLIIYFFSNMRKDNRMKAIFLVALIGLLISQIFWIPTITKYGVEGSNSVSDVLSFRMFSRAEGSADSSGGVTYSFKDFMNAPPANKIDQPIGVGTALFIIFLISTLVLIWRLPKMIKAKKEYSTFVLPLLIWTALVTLLVMGNSLPFVFTFIPHRLWPYFSIGLILLTILGGSTLLTIFKQKSVKTLIVLVLLVLVFITSFVPKYQVQTSIWPPGPEFVSPDEFQGYLSMSQSLPFNTKVYALCSANEKIAGSNMGVVYADPDLKILKNNLTMITDPGLALSTLFYNKGIKYVIVDTECVKQHGLNATNNILTSLRARSFPPAIINNGFFLLQVP